MADKTTSTVWEKRFKETADLLPGIICEADRDLRVTYANEFAFKAFRYNEEDIEAGVYLKDLIHPDDLERSEKNVMSVFDGEFVGPQEYRLVHKDGTMSDYQINSAPLYEDDRLVGIRTCIFDISQRKRAAEELRKSEERFRRIFAESPIGIALFDGEGHMLDANQAYRRMFSLTSDSEPPEDGTSLFRVLNLDDAGRETLMSGVGMRYSAWFTLPSGGASTGAGERYLDWHLGRLASEEDGGDMVIAQVHDVTERRTKLEEARVAADRAMKKVQHLEKRVLDKFTVSDMVSQSPEMKKIFDILPQVAVSPTTVLVTGESGTGKELVAKALHQLSPRKKKPFVAINCSALPDTLLESELFGYKKGAFTDAQKDKPGKFALAEGGVLFLDEIGDISPAMQVKLLRVLQERTYEPLGGVGSVRADVRVIVATHRNLKEMVETGEFREDLFYRMNVLKITLPPLRERKMDIPLLTTHFIRKLNERYGRSIEGISKAVLDRLLAHDFKGNIRELENIIEHAFVFCTEGEISVSHLPEEISETRDDQCAKALRGIGSFDDLEAHYLRAVLEETGGSRIEAARRLGIHKSTLFRKLKKLGISGD